MNVLERLAEKLAYVLFAAAAFAIVGMMFHVTVDILSRFILNQPLIGTLEIVASYYMVACAYLPLAFVQVQRNHIVIDLFTQKFSLRSIRVLDLFACTLGVILIGLMAWQTTLVAIEKTRIREAVEATVYQLPVWPSRWLIAIAATVTAFVLILQISRDVQRICSPVSELETSHDRSLV